MCSWEVSTLRALGRLLPPRRPLLMIIGSSRSSAKAALQKSRRLAQHILTGTEMAVEVTPIGQQGSCSLQRLYHRVHMMKALHRPKIIRLPWLAPRRDSS
uniref:Uncharacterized protein n=1 Tax=Macaca nemestrina TaxID=9545 RepID=A0A2K6B150_MACNE